MAPEEFKVLLEQALSEQWQRLTIELAELPERIVARLAHDEFNPVATTQARPPRKLMLWPCTPQPIGDVLSNQSIEVSSGDELPLQCLGSAGPTATGVIFEGKGVAVAMSNGFVPGPPNCPRPPECLKADEERVSLGAPLAEEAPKEMPGAVESLAAAAELPAVHPFADAPPSDIMLVPAHPEQQLLASLKEASPAPSSSGSGNRKNGGIYAGSSHGSSYKEHPKTAYEAFVEGPIFTTISSAAIVGNTMYVGYDSHAKVTNELRRIASESVSELTVVPDYVFTFFFVAELLMKVAAQQRRFIFGPDFYWNIFDVVLIGASVYDLFSGSGGSLSVWRILRIFRLIRLLKVIRRVEILESLNCMVYGIINSFAPLLWATVVLIIIMYAFAVFFMSGISGHLANQEVGTSDDHIDRIDNYYGTMYRAMCTLFEAVTGGNDWGELGSPLKEISEAFYLTYGLYIVFVTLGVLNVVTGFFVEGTMQQSLSGREEMTKQAIQQKSHMAELLRDCFHMLDSDGSGSLSLDELEEHLDDPSLQEYMDTLQIDKEQALALFDILSKPSGDDVPINDFVEGATKMTLPVKSLDIYSIMAQNKKVLDMVEEISARMPREPLNL